MTNDASKAGGDVMVTGVILAAGLGSRMSPFDRTYPKALMPAVDRPLVVHQLEQMRDAGIRRVLLVVRGGALKDWLGDGSAWGLRLEYVAQDEPLGIAHALWVTRSHVQTPIVVMLGDVYCTIRDFRSAVERLRSDNAAAVLLSKQEPSVEAMRKNFSISATDAGRVVKVVEKPLRPESDIKGCGVYLFKPVIFDVLAHTPRSLLRNEYELTDAIQQLIDEGHAVWHLQNVGVDVNLTVPRDIVELNVNLLKEAGQERYISPAAEVAATVYVVDSTICAGAKLTGHGTLTRCVVLADTHVELQGNYAGSIFAPGLAVHC